MDGAIDSRAALSEPQQTMRRKRSSGGTGNKGQGGFHHRRRIRDRPCLRGHVRRGGRKCRYRRYIHETLGKETVELIAATGGNALFTKADVRDSDELDAAIAAAVDTFGRLGYAVNSAGVEVLEPFMVMTETDWDFVTDTNVKGVWRSMRSEIAVMLPAGGGAVVNISSIAGLIGYPSLATYVAAKSGGVGLTRSAALEFAGQGVRVNCVCPGNIDIPMYRGGLEENREATELGSSMTPLKRIGTPEELAYAVVITGAGRAFRAGLDLAAGTDPRDTFTDWRRSPTAPPGPNSILTERNCLSGETAGELPCASSTPVTGYLGDQRSRRRCRCHDDARD